jgi:hypothetical protein
MKQIELNDVVRDTVTGFQGIALAHMVAVHEASQWRVHPQTLNADRAAASAFMWIEETRLVTVEGSGHPAGFRA